MILANIVLFAHSFIPHDHVHAAPQNDVAVVSCNCSSCSIHEKIELPSDSEKGCGCCAHGGKGCFIKGGYLSQHGNDEIVIFTSYIVVPSIIQITPVEESVSTSYTVINAPLPSEVILKGIGMRAPPVHFS